MTHAVIAQFKEHQSTDFAAVLRGPLCEPGPTMGALEDAGKGERKAPTLANVNKLTSKHQIGAHYTELFSTTQDETKW